MLSVPATTAVYDQSPDRVTAVGLSWLERAVLMVGVVEIPLQVDKYILYSEEDAALGSIGGFNLSLTTVALLVLYGLWIGDLALHRRRWRHSPVLGGPMLVYLVAIGLSVFVAAIPLLALSELFLMAQTYLLFFYLANRLETADDVAFLLKTMAVALFLESAIILAAAARGMDDEVLTIGQFRVTVTEGRRHAGTMVSPNLAGSALVMLWIPVAAQLTFLRRRWLWRFAMLAAAMGLLALLLTQSRGALVTLVIGSFVFSAGMAWRGWLPPWTVALAVMFVALGAYPVLVIYQSRVQHGDNDSASARKHLSLIALEAIQQRPILGHGAGNCHLAMQDLADQAEYRGEWFFTVHCKYLLVWVETGCIGLVAFMAMLGTGVWQGLRTWYRRDPVYSALGLALTAAIMGQMLHMVVEIFNGRTIVQLLWCVLGMTAALHRLSTTSPPPRGPRPMPAVNTHRWTSHGSRVLRSGPLPDGGQA